MRRFWTILPLLACTLTTQAGADMLFGSRKPSPSVEEEERQFLARAGTSIRFKVDELSLNQDAKASLDRVIIWLKDRPEHSAIVEGHSDDPTTDEFNLALGEKRANVVKAFMMAGGIEASRLRTVSYGRARPLIKDGSNWNNRVEILVKQQPEPRPPFPN
ncbi:MAG: OmpA family protein [Phaeospirillum sp.]|nr:OmpA family protein [Phaeospirillum sp.]